MRQLAESDVRRLLQTMIDEAGGVRAFAKELGCTPSYVCDMRLGRRAPAPAVLERLGLVKVVRYWPKEWVEREG